MPIERRVGAAALAGAAVVALWPAGAAAQGVGDDVRCLLLSSAVGRVAKDEAPRRVAAMTASFYLGRLSGRLTDPAVAAAVRAQGAGMPAAQAEPLMRACAARAAAAERGMAAVATKAQRR